MKKRSVRKYLFLYVFFYSGILTFVKKGGARMLSIFKSSMKKALKETFPEWKFNFKSMSFYFYLF